MAIKKILTEAQILHDVHLALGREPDVVLWRNSTGMISHDKRFVRYGLCPGSADLIGVGPGGKFLALEVKRMGGLLSREQEMFLALVQHLGGIAATVHSVAEAQAVLEKVRKKLTRGGI